MIWEFNKTGQWECDTIINFGHDILKPTKTVLPGKIFIRDSYETFIY